MRVPITDLYDEASLLPLLASVSLLFSVLPGSYSPMHAQWRPSSLTRCHFSSLLNAAWLGQHCLHFPSGSSAGFPPWWASGLGMPPSCFHHTISSFWAFSSDVTSFFSDSLGRGQVTSHRDLSFSGLIMNLPCRTIVCLYVFHSIEICPSLSSSWTSHTEAWCVYMSFLPTSKLQKTETEFLNLVCPVSWLTCSRHHWNVW